jgi:hypothetical protein
VTTNAIIQDLVFDRHCPFRLKMSIQNPADGTPIALSSFDAKLEVRAGQPGNFSGTAAISLPLVEGDDVDGITWHNSTGPTDDTWFQVLVTGDTVDTLTVLSDYFYDLLLTINGEKTKAMTGRVTVGDTVTQS